MITRAALEKVTIFNLCEINKKLFVGIMIPKFLTKSPPTVEFRSDQVKFPEATPTDLWGWLNIA